MNSNNFVLLVVALIFIVFIVIYIFHENTQRIESFYDDSDVCADQLSDQDCLKIGRCNWVNNTCTASLDDYAK